MTTFHDHNGYAPQGWVADRLAQWWVHVERDPVGRQEPSGRYTTEWDEVPDVLVGPYETVEAATLAMNESLLVRGLVEENALDCYVEPLDVQVIDPLNPDHTGGPNH